jgi:tail tube protein
MTLKKSIDSAVVGLRIAEESVDIGILGGSPVWVPLEPNSYGDFGVELTSLAREPIADDRQAKAGMVVDLDASGGFQSDLTQQNIQEPLQGFFFADLRRKDEFGNGSGVFTSVTTTYNAASGLGIFEVDALTFHSGFTSAQNNGFKRVTVSTAAALTVTPAPIAEAAPPAAAKITQVGRQFGAGVLDVDAAGALPAYTAASGLDTLGLSIGEWVFGGGDATITKFVNAGNNGFKRIRSVTATRMEFDKSLTTMVTEASTTETVQLFIPRALKNEVGALIKRRTYQLERTLGASDNAAPTQIQSEYLVGAVANTMKMSIGVADKVGIDLGYMAMTGETRTGVVGVKSGTRPNLVEQDAFNTSSDFTFMRISPVQTSGATSTALFGFLTEVNLELNNNAKALKAIGVLGAFEIMVGKFQVSGDITAYFTDVASIEAIKANQSCTLDGVMVKDNSGILFDVPLIKLGNGRLNIEMDEAITIPVSYNAASGAQVNAALDHTMMLNFFDYLPNAAQ